MLLNRASSVARQQDPAMWPKSVMGQQKPVLQIASNLLQKLVGFLPDSVTL